MSSEQAALAVLYSAAGGSEVIGVGDRAVRAPAEGEVRIRVSAATVNPTDLLLRERGAPNLSPPFTPGMDAAGMVEALGEGVDRFAVGEAVMAVVEPRRPEGGAQATLIVVPAASVTAIPAGLAYIEAATLPMNGMTALYALDRAGLSAGQTLAVSGGAGWLAYLTIRFAKARGLRVIADAKLDETEVVRGYGADVVVARGEDFASAVRAAVPLGVDAFLDTAVLGEAVFGALADRGVYVPVRGWNGGSGPRGVQIRPVLVYEVFHRTEWLDEIRVAVETGVIAPRVAQTFPLSGVVEAQQAMAAGGVRGRIVLTL